MFSLDKKIEIINHAREFGIPSAVSAFKVSKSSIYSWSNKYFEHWGDIDFLKNKSTRPKRVRYRVWDKRIWEYIQILRIEHPGLTKEKVYVLLNQECKLWQIKCPSVATIGRIISGYKKNHQIPIWSPRLSFYANNDTFRSKTRKKINKPRPKKEDFIYPGQRIQIDSIILLHKGIRRYVIQAIDVYSRFVYAKAYKTLSSSSSKDFIINLEQAFPFIDLNTEFQTDNGSEFLDQFQKYLQDHNYKQFWNYPHSPKMNAYVERVNGITQQEFIYRNLNLLFNNLDQFNRQLSKQIHWYNTKRPHLSLQCNSPVQYINLYLQNSKMWWTRTID